MTANDTTRIVESIADLRGELRAQNATLIGSLERINDKVTIITERTVDHEARIADIERKYSAAETALKTSKAWMMAIAAIIGTAAGAITGYVKHLLGIVP